MNNKLAVLSPIVLALGLLSGCNDQKNTKNNVAPAPRVIVSPVTAQPVSASAEFVGQAMAFQSVDIRARVTGFLTERPFKEGNDVKSGDTLFVIDPSQFEAARDSVVAKVAGATATIKETESQLARYLPLSKGGTITVAKLEEARASVGRARADLAAAQADLKSVELDVGYTVIQSPIDGRIGSSAVDVGNLIGPNSEILATVVALDPIRVSFTISERDYLNYSQSMASGESVEYGFKIRLANGQLFPHEGELDFIENRVDPSTGTIKIRVVFPNPESLILPGQFINVILVSSDPEVQVVVPQAAIQANQSGPFVLVVDGDNLVELRSVKTGQLVGPQIAVTDGLEVGETIIVEGIQKVRPGAKVNPVSQKAAQ